MDGYEVIKRLHALPQLAKIPVIAITGNDLPLDYRRGISAGFSAYLTKPIDVFTLLGTLDTLLGLTPPN
jgi:CheY-like chemotaxis protein